MKPISRFLGVKKRAFTLVEILVVIGIVVLIGSIGLANYRSREKDNLMWEAEKVMSLLKRAQSYSLQAKEHNAEGETHRPKGYGVVFFQNEGRYLFYADFVDPVDYRFTDIEELISEYSLSSNIIFHFLGSQKDILFALPQATVYQDGQEASSQIDITLIEFTTQRQKNIFIDPISKSIDVRSD